MPTKATVSNKEILEWCAIYEGTTASMRDIAKMIGRSPNFVRDRMAHLVSLDKRAKIVAKAKGRPSSRKGAKLSPEHRAAISARSKGNKYCTGRVVNDKTRQKMRNSALLRAERERSSDPMFRSKQQPTRDQEIIAAFKRIDHQRQKMKRVLFSLLRPAKIKKQDRTSAIVGYSRDELVRHIESQFQTGMSWDDRSTFSIDHIIPVAEFLRRGITDPKIVCSLANLRPLAVKDNQRKSDSYSGNFEADLAKIVAFNENMRRQVLQISSSVRGYQPGLPA